MPRVNRRTRVPPPAMQDRPGRWQLLARRWRKAIAPAGAALAFVGIMGIAAGAVQVFGEGESLRERWGHATAPFGLRVRDVRVEGRLKTPEALLNAAIGVTPGEPILGYSVAAARARIETIAWVASASVERHLPDTIVVRLVERRPFAVWQRDGRFSLVDREGDIVTDSDVATFAAQLPLIVGPGAPQAAAALVDALEQYPELRSRMVAAVRVGERRWNLRMKSGADILLPEGAEPQALARLMALHASHGLLDRALQVVDMRLPDRLAVRAASNKRDDPARGETELPVPPPAVRRPT